MYRFFSSIIFSIVFVSTSFAMISDTDPTAYIWQRLGITKAEHIPIDKLFIGVWFSPHQTKNLDHALIVDQRNLLTTESQWPRLRVPTPKSPVPGAVLQEFGNEFSSRLMSNMTAKSSYTSWEERPLYCIVELKKDGSNDATPESLSAAAKAMVDELFRQNGILESSPRQKIEIMSPQEVITALKEAKDEEESVESYSHILRIVYSMITHAKILGIQQSSLPELLEVIKTLEIYIEMCHQRESSGETVELEIVKFLGSYLSRLGH